MIIYLFKDYFVLPKIEHDIGVVSNTVQIWDSFNICDAIKQNESEVPNTDVEIQLFKREKNPLFSIVLQNFQPLVSLELTNFHGVFC